MIVNDNLDSPPTTPFVGRRQKAQLNQKSLRSPNLRKYVDGSEPFNVYVGGAYIWETPYMNDILKRGARVSAHFMVPGVYLTVTVMFFIFVV